MKYGVSVDYESRVPLRSIVETFRRRGGELVMLSHYPDGRKLGAYAVFETRADARAYLEVHYAKEATDGCAAAHDEWLESLISEVD